MTKRNVGGRPALPKGQVLRRKALRLNDSDDAETIKAAKAAGLTWSQWARSVLVRAARRALR